MNIQIEFKEKDVKTMLILQMMEKIEAAYKNAGSAWNDSFEKDLMRAIYDGLGEWQAVIEHKDRT